MNQFRIIEEGPPTGADLDDLGACIEERRRGQERDGDNGGRMGRLDEAMGRLEALKGTTDLATDGALEAAMDIVTAIYKPQPQQVEKP